MIRKIFSVFALLSLMSCGSGSGATEDGSEVIREASAAPESFSAVFAGNPADSDCQSRLIDPVDQVELILSVPCRDKEIIWYPLENIV